MLCTVRAHAIDASLLIAARRIAERLPARASAAAGPPTACCRAFPFVAPPRGSGLMAASLPCSSEAPASDADDGKITAGPAERSVGQPRGVVAARCRSLRLRTRSSSLSCHLLPPRRCRYLPSLRARPATPPACLPACRNKEPILAVLREHLGGASGLFLELASGTGQHCAHFAAALPGLTFQPTERDPVGPNMQGATMARSAAEALETACAVLCCAACGSLRLPLPSVLSISSPVDPRTCSAASWHGRATCPTCGRHCSWTSRGRRSAGQWPKAPAPRCLSPTWRTSRE